VDEDFNEEEDLMELDRAEARKQKDQSDEKGQLDVQDKLVIKPFMLATISSRYDEEEFSAMDSVAQSSTKNSRNRNNFSPSRTGSSGAHSKNKKSNNPQAQGKSNESENRIRNLTLTESYDLNEMLKADDVCKQ
jgi:hypothetical protein